MNKQEAIILINDYLTAWRTGDKALFSSTLAFDSDICGMDGGHFMTLQESEKWFDACRMNKPRSPQWEVKHLTYDYHEQAASVLWQEDSGESKILGCSVFHFRRGRIQHVEEYRMNGNPQPTRQLGAC